MWNYALFVPAALLLGFLAVSVTRAGASLPITRASVLAFCLWLLSWFATVALLYAQSPGNLASSFIARRDLGYWSGSALLMGAPFVVVLAAGRLLTGTQWAQATRRLAVLLLASALWFLTPWLFFVGWVMGCVALGYTSCM